MPRKKKEAATALTTALGLKIVAAGGIAHGRFRWPLEVGAVVTAPDWSPEPTCGGGLHFWPRGEGDVTSCRCHADPGAVGLVVEYDPATAIDLGGKAKAPRCTVVFVGSVRDAAAWIAARCAGARVIYGTATAGYSGTATAGYSGTATAGDSGTATAGARGTATAGDYGTATAGDYGTATAGYSGTGTAGARGTATAGDYGTATAGYSGTATAGYSGTATAGDYGTISVLYYDRARSVYRRRVAECDPAGPVKPWRRYSLDADGQWIDKGEVPESERPPAILAAALAKASGK